MTSIAPDPAHMPAPDLAERYLVPGMSATDSTSVVQLLESRLVASIDLQLVLKHIHWNVVGPNFIAVHEMLDEQVDAVREMTDDIAERIATLGAVPNGNPGAVVARRTWDDYPLGREDALVHLAALDRVYDGVIADHREAIDLTAELDPITEDLLIEHTRKLEVFQWFVRSFAQRAVTS